MPRLTSRQLFYNGKPLLGIALIHRWQELGPNESGTAAPAWVARAKELLQDTSNGSQVITQVAKELGLHPVYFARAFRRAFRCSPAEYRMRCRLGKAMGLLHNRTLALSELSLRAGFFDQSHFTRAFRDHFGISPTRIEKIFENARVRFNSYKYLSNRNAIMASGALS